MKPKNLEKAVVLSIMLMSLHSGVTAETISNLEEIKNTEQTLTGGNTYIIQNQQTTALTSDVIIADSGKTTTLHVGSGANDEVTLGAKNSNRTYLKASGDNSKIVVDGGILTFTKDDANGYTGPSLAMDITGGANIDLKNAATIIGENTINSTNYFRGINVATYDTDKSNKSSLNIAGDLTLYAYGYNWKQNTAEAADRNIISGLTIYSSDFTTKGNTFINMEARENGPTFEGRSFGETAGVLIGHNRTNNKANTAASNVTFGDDVDDTTTIAAQYGYQVTGLRIDSNGDNEADTVTFNGKAVISAKNSSGSTDYPVKSGAFAVSNTGGNLIFNNDVDLTASGPNNYPTPNVTGLEIEKGTNTVKGHLNISAQAMRNPNASGQNSIVNVAGIDAKDTTLDGNSLYVYARGSGNAGELNVNAVKSDASQLDFDGAVEIEVRTYGTKGNQQLAGINAVNSSTLNFGNSVAITMNPYAEGDNIDATAVKANGSNVNVAGSAVFSADKAIAASNKAVVDFKSGFTAYGRQEGDATVISADGEGTSIKINSGKTGVVNYTGTTSVANKGTIDMNLTEENSVWNVTGNSELTNLESRLNTVIDMTQAKELYNTLKVESLTAGDAGDGGVIKMNIDGSAANTADRLYITGTHSGNHYISIDDTVTGTAAGTVLLSVGNEQGTFAAEKTEGALYWNSYDLAQQDSATDGYTKDWIISEVKQDQETQTTGVAAIMGANALNYHTWRAENDQLMQRMGELRNNGADEQGAWFRVRGSKISRDDNAAFENQYTSYELGYDQITKQNEDVTRYTGAAISYTDGDSSYERGGGENHSKAISFYNTDIYSSGHYLDMVFKFANMDNDFNVFDTNGSAISGEYKNSGISLSAEYGRKNDLNGGWYIEPQAQLTLGYFGGDSYETSNGIMVDQSGITSVLGRAGFNIGKEIGDAGVIYAKANILHEFAGDYDINMRDGAGNHRAESASFNDTWFEYGVGAALKTGKNNHLYFDFVKTAGGDFEKDWQWNAGMRWTF